MMHLWSRATQPSGSGWNIGGVLSVGMVIGAGFGFLAANSYHGGWNWKHTTETEPEPERNLFINGIKEPFEPAAPEPWDPAFDPEKEFTTAAAKSGIQFDKTWRQVRSIVIFCPVMFVHLYLVL